MELFKANSQWSTRPADQRFESLQSLYDQCKRYADSAVERHADVSGLRTEANGADVQLVGRQNVPALLTNWAFGQLSARIGAPASYLRQLPPTLACQNLNHGLANLANKSDKAQLLFHQNGSLLLRAFTSDKYSRIWNWEVAERLLGMQSQGWEPAKPDTHWGQDTVGQCIACNGSGNDGQCQYCAGTGREFPALYASDHDMFAFIRNRSAIVREPGNPDGLQRGVIVENSEVGASSLKMTRFLYREMCGNHIIWGASKVVDIAIRHVGDFARGRFDSVYRAELRRYVDESSTDVESAIVRAKECLIAGDKESVLDKLFGMRALSLSRKTLESGYDAVQISEDGSPNTVWGMVQGLTRHSQTVGHADIRTGIDRAAGKLLDGAF